MLLLFLITTDSSPYSLVSYYTVVTTVAVLHALSLSFSAKLRYSQTGYPLCCKPNFSAFPEVQGTSLKYDPIYVS